MRSQPTFTLKDFNMSPIKSITISLSLAASFVLVGCGDSSIVKSFDSAKDKVCACDTVECAEKAMEAIEIPDSEPSKSDMEKVEKISDEMGKCMTKLRGEN